MKKTYIEPQTKSVVLKLENLLGSLSGDGVNVTVNNSDASYDAESRSGFWDDED